MDAHRSTSSCSTNAGAPPRRAAGACGSKNTGPTDRREERAERRAKKRPASAGDETRMPLGLRLAACGASMKAFSASLRINFSRQSIAGSNQYKQASEGFHQIFTAADSLLWQVRDNPKSGHSWGRTARSPRRPSRPLLRQIGLSAQRQVVRCDICERIALLYRIQEGRPRRLPVAGRDSPGGEWPPADAGGVFDRNFSTCVNCRIDP